MTIPRSSIRTVRRLPAHRVRPFALLLTLAVLFAGTNIVSSGGIAAQAAPGDPNPPDIAERHRPDRITWQPCPENAELECGTLRLPVDYHTPRGEQFDMAVIRAKATDPSRRIGVLMLNPGGPGASGIDFVLTGIRLGAPISTRLRERFDLVSFDPRGAARSRPVRCEVTFDEPPSNGTDAEIAAHFDDLSRRYVHACREQNGSFIFTMSMNNIARDMDMLRIALGERQISYGGASLGTQLGAVYASLFPHRLRATVLDAGVAPETRDDLVEFCAAYSSAFEFALQHLDHLCRRATTCSLREPGVLAAFDTVVARLEEHAVTSPEGVQLTADSVRNVIGELLYVERSWPVIVDALADARSGDYTLLFQLLPVATGFNDALIPIVCNTYGTRRAAADLLPFDEAFNGANPRFFGRFTLLETVSLCAAWPQGEDTIIRNVQREVATPIVLIGNDFDNATPLSSTRGLAFALGMERSVVRYQGGGHGVTTSGNPCTDDVIVAYLTTLRLPSEGYTCPALPVSFAPRASAARASTSDQLDLWGSEMMRGR